jgi:hypothetical protein
MDPNCKPVHARACTASKSVEQQSQQIKENVRLVNIGIFEEDYFSELASSSPKFTIPKKSEQ